MVVLVTQSDEWRMLGENCEAGWAQSVSAWDHFQGSTVLEWEALWSLRCCVVLKWPQSPLRLWSSPTTERDLRWYIITVQNVLVRGNAMLNIVWWTTSFFSWERHCGRVGLQACWSLRVVVGIYSNFLICWFYHDGSLLLVKWDLQEDVLRRRRRV